MLNPLVGLLAGRRFVPLIARVHHVGRRSGKRYVTSTGAHVAGDTLVIAGRPFTIRGVISQEPGRRVGAFSFGSRVIVGYDDFQATGLLSFGSRASYQILLRVRDDGVTPLVTTLRREFRDRFVGVRSYKSTEDQIGDDLMRAENYLSLVGFVILILGGIGVWSVTRVFVRQKIRSVAILKCVGATTAQVLSAYVVQVYPPIGAVFLMIGPPFFPAGSIVPVIHIVRLGQVGPRNEQK